jgi:hypothetical protein
MDLENFPKYDVELKYSVDFVIADLEITNLNFDPKQ